MSKLFTFSDKVLQQNFPLKEYTIYVGYHKLDVIYKNDPNYELIISQLPNYEKSNLIIDLLNYINFLNEQIANKSDIRHFFGYDQNPKSLYELKILTRFKIIENNYVIHPYEEEIAEKDRIHTERVWIKDSESDYKHTKMYIEFLKNVLGEICQEE